jgi:hypothetical protein
MIEKDRLLWEKIQAFELDDPDSSFTFTDRLARENGWTLKYALRAVEEYKKFMFLICASGQSLTPSDQVDQVWHLHLLYTQSYWEDFCEHTLGRKIQHGPTRGGQKERDKYTDLYELAQQQYRSYFKAEPPDDIWPPGKERFSQINFERVNRDTHWVIPKFSFWRKWKK